MPPSDAPLGERSAEGGDHRRRERVVHTAGEEHVVFVGAWIASVAQVRQDDTHHRVPQHEAGSRADMAAALATFEDEPARATLEEGAQQIR